MDTGTHGQGREHTWVSKVHKQEAWADNALEGTVMETVAAESDI